MWCASRLDWLLSTNRPRPWSSGPEGEDGRHIERGLMSDRSRPLTALARPAMRASIVAVALTSVIGAPAQADHSLFQRTRPASSGASRHREASSTRARPPTARACSSTPTNSLSRATPMPARTSTSGRLARRGVFSWARSTAMGRSTRPLLARQPTARACSSSPTSSWSPATRMPIGTSTSGPAGRPGDLGRRRSTATGRTTLPTAPPRLTGQWSPSSRSSDSLQMTPTRRSTSTSVPAARPRVCRRESSGATEASAPCTEVPRKTDPGLLRDR